MLVARARAFILPSVMTIAIVAALVGLGVWQLERRVAKLALISAMDRRLAEPPTALPPASQWDELTPATAEFRRVRFAAVPAAGAPAQVFAAPSSLRKDVSGTGVWVFAPVGLADGATVVVNRGFVPDGQRAPAAAPAASPETLTGYIRFPEARGWLTPPPDAAKRMWFLRDHRAMAASLGWGQGGTVAPFYIDLESPVPPGGLPRPGPLQVNLKNDHLQYAITWFLLAAAVTAVFAVWVRGQRRRAA